MRVGNGSLRFELVEGWERLPDGWSHADVASVCTDSSGTVFLFCRGDHPVIVFDRDGSFRGSWGEGMFSKRTHGMYMSRDDSLILTDDGGNCVARYTVDGRFVEGIGPQGAPADTGFTGVIGEIKQAAGPYNRPTNASSATSGETYVSDGYGNARIHRFGPAGDLVQSWGAPGSGPGEFRIPHSVWAHRDGRILVADRENDRIQVFDSQGGYQTEWTDIQRPQDIFVDDAGLIYVAEFGWRAGDRSFAGGSPRTVAQAVPARVSILDPDGEPLLRWSSPDSGAPGYFIAPHGIWVDDEGSIYVAEVTHTFAVSRGLAQPGSHSLQKFARL